MSDATQSYQGIAQFLPNWALYRSMLDQISTKMYRLIMKIPSPKYCPKMLTLSYSLISAQNSSNKVEREEDPSTQNKNIARARAGSLVLPSIGKNRLGPPVLS